jgi:spore germination cell wall hydrolase CwlJ-like protein
MILMKLRYIHIFLFFVIAFFLAKAVMQDHKMEKYTQQSLSEVAVLARKTVKAVNTEHLRCLATNIYWEAAGEPFMGQVAVARVVVNRVKHGFASNPCKVVYQTNIIPDLNSVDGIKRICQFLK